MDTGVHSCRRPTAHSVRPEVLMNVAAYGRAGHIPTARCDPRPGERISRPARVVVVSVSSLRGRRKEFTVTRVVNPDPQYRRLPAESASGRLIGPYDRLGSVRFNVRPCFSIPVTDAEDPLLGSRTVMLSLRNHVECRPLPARSHPHRPTMDLGRPSGRAHGLQRLRAWTAGRPRALVYPGE